MKMNIWCWQAGQAAASDAWADRSVETDISEDQFQPLKWCSTTATKFLKFDIRLFSRIVKMSVLIAISSATRRSIVLPVAIDQGKDATVSKQMGTRPRSTVLRGKCSSVSNGKAIGFTPIVGGLLSNGDAMLHCRVRTGVLS